MSDTIVITLDDASSAASYATAAAASAAAAAASATTATTEATAAEEAATNAQTYYTDVQTILQSSATYTTSINQLTLEESTGYGIVTGLEVSAQSTANMTVAVAAGTVHLPSGYRYAISAVSSQTISNADSTKPRIDLIYVSSAGAVTYEAGELGTVAVAGSDTYTLTTNFASGDTIVFDGITFTVTTATQDSTDFVLGSTIATSMTNFATALNANSTISATYTATVNDGVITVAETTAGGGNMPGSMTVTGTGVITAGTATTSTEASATTPTLPSGALSLAQISVTANATAITATDITDTRILKTEAKEYIDGINAMYPPEPLVGIRGDGTSDDTSRLKSIVSYAKTNSAKVFIPPCTVLTSSPIQLYDNVAVIGSGINSTIMLNTATSVFVNYDPDNPTDTDSWSNNINIEGVGFRGDTDTSQTVPHLTSDTSSLNKHLFVDCSYSVSSYTDSNTGLTVTHSYSYSTDARCAVHLCIGSSSRLDNLYAEGFDIGFQLEGGSMYKIDKLSASWNKIAFATNYDPVNNSTKTTTISMNTCDFSYNYIDLKLKECQDSNFVNVNYDRASLGLWLINVYGLKFESTYCEIVYDAVLNEGSYGNDNIMEKCYFYWVNDSGTIKLQRGKWYLKSLRGGCAINIANSTASVVITDLDTSYTVTRSTSYPYSYIVGSSERLINLLYPDPFFLLNGTMITYGAGISSVTYSADSECSAKNILVAVGTAGTQASNGLRIALPSSITIPQDTPIRINFEYQYTGSDTVAAAPIGIKYGSNLLAHKTLTTATEWTTYEDALMSTSGYLSPTYTYGTGGFSGTLSIRNLFIYIGEQKPIYNDLYAPLGQACTTANRPTKGIIAGYSIFDSTLGYPIWYSGSAWVNYAGTTV